MMAAKALVPLPPPDMITALFMLTSDPDEKVRATALESAGKLPDRILSSALRDEEVDPPVLGWFLDRLAKQDVYAEMLVLNASTPDDAVARAASHCSARTAEIISQNQLRLLRHEDVVRQLCSNPSCGPALIDSVCDFCVRSGLILADVPQMRDGAGAHLRPGGRGRRRRTWDPPPTRSSRSTRSWRTRTRPRWRRGSGSPSRSGS